MNTFAMDWSKYIQTTLSMIILTFVSFFIHRKVQRVYFETCVGDIFQIMFFKNSTFCRLMSSCNQTIEVIFLHMVSGVQEILYNALKI
jgi:hypothetical protein